MLFSDWRGYVIAFFSVVWVANVYMNLYGAIRLDLRKDRAEIKKVEKEVEQVDRELKGSKAPELKIPAA
jgi:hypothetical protein